MAATPAEKLERLVGILRGFACEGAVKLIVLDSWRYLVNTFLGYNENSFVDCTLVWDAVRAVCKEENCAMLVIAHFKKLDTRDRGELIISCTSQPKLYLKRLLYPCFGKVFKG